MEKRVPHCKLSVVRLLIDEGKVRTTVSAFEGARLLGINTLAEMSTVVRSLTPDNFYKSMTSHADHRIWQDVYRTQIPNGQDIYLKLTVVDDVLIVSFKEL
jgi:motility quorum-sensing regulator / GCU-specific mRNA interferase toxin